MSHSYTKLYIINASHSLAAFGFDSARDGVRRYTFAHYKDQLSLPLDDVSGIGNSYDWGGGVIRRLHYHCVKDVTQ